jgi:hypothetical protein
MNPRSYRDNLAYYRQHPDKLDSLERMNNFAYGAMLGAGLFGFMAGIVMHTVATLVAGDAATHMPNGLLHVPVTLGMLIVAWISLVFLQGAWAIVAGMTHNALFRHMLEEQGAVAGQPPNVIPLRFAGLAVGALVGVFGAAIFLFAL